MGVYGQEGNEKVVLDELDAYEAQNKRRVSGRLAWGGPSDADRLVKELPLSVRRPNPR